ncbi:TMV resistance protein N [Morella rubra]|uniref:ADP-ribosyl cyclase/cyclic ADP-ribose hydrolase n=1 Tax=Morella rubra TaxID=262757 RepID=A0A6A1WIF8_9ROSI|nr:TMV resistance protein N [Morella rubra]
MYRSSTIMDYHEGQTENASRGLKRKQEPSSEDRKEDRKVLVLGPREDHQDLAPEVLAYIDILNSTVELSNDVYSNPTTNGKYFPMAAQSLLSSSKPGANQWKYDVFLSFRGEDTRKNFIDHLYSALVRVGIRTFRDEDDLSRGENISTELLNVIQESRISIVVFSKGYASSRWCLNELMEILQCTKTRGHTLLPIFYYVKPSDVRNQTGAFAKAFARHEERFQYDMEQVQRWRVALIEAANCSGWDLESVSNGYEWRFTDKIVEEVFCKVKPVHLDVAIHPIGMKSRVEQMETLLHLGANDVRIVGIYGMAGIGKTTVAKAVYNQICDRFEGSSFLLNIRANSEQSNGLVHLQEQVLFDILKLNNLKIASIDEGITLIEERIRGKRVLVILDDVDDLRQIYSLVGHCEWFGPGSRVIATTRDEHLLTQLRVNSKYEVKQLDQLESLQLFSCHAFQIAHPVEGFWDLSIRAVKYAGGVPLALEVLGSFLSGRNIIEWESELKILQKAPHNKIQKILRVSFDSLEDDRKFIFLDIACFFIGWEKEYVIKVLDACGFSSISGIRILIQRSLLRIDVETNSLCMI